MTQFEVLGISGKSGTGKDYIGTHFLKPLGFQPFSLSWHFKVWLVGKGEANHTEVFHTKPDRVRTLLQEEGTERGRNVYGNQIWCNTVQEWMEVLAENMDIKRFYVPDIRFVDEVEFVHKLGGRVIHIEAPKRANGNKLSLEQRQHISETALDTYQNFDMTLYNDPEHQEKVRKQLCDFLGCAPIIEEDASSLMDDVMNQMDKTWDSFESIYDRIERLNKKIFGE